LKSTPTYEKLILEIAQLKEQLSNREQQIIDLQSFPDNDPNPVFRFSKHGHVLMYANSAGKDIIHYLDDPNNLPSKKRWYRQLESTFVSGENSSIELDMGSEVFRGRLILKEDRNFINIYAADISAIKRARLSIQASEEKYRGILEAMELGILELDSEGTIQRAYPFFCTSLGYTQKELVGQKANRVLMPTEWANYMREKRLNRDMSQAEVLEIQMTTNNGDLRWMLVSSAPIHNETHEVAGSIEVHLDITERKKIEAELRAAKQKAEASSMAKEQFLANMSHEIRTPLNAINGLTDLLFDLGPNKAQKDYLSAIKTSSDNLLVIINDILDYSKIETGNLTLESIGFDLKKTISDQMAVFKLKAMENSVDLRLVEDKRVSDVLMGDPVRMGQILVNLMSNAIKFTPNGTVAVAYELLEQTATTNMIEIQVIDNGVGINPENLEEIFKSFQQEDNTISRKFGGTGLGLAITRQLVELHGAKLKVESQKKFGSTFSFKVKFDVGTKADLPSEERLSPDEFAFTDLKILLAEDHEINQILATNLLEKFGAEVDVAENGIEVLKKIQRKEYDVVLMDMQMPRMNGLTATTAIREKLLMGIPIIAVTANVMPAEKKKCFAVGMNGYVAKPYDAGVMFEAIAKVIDRKKIRMPALRKAEASLKKNTPAEQIAGPTRKLYSLKNLERISGGNNDFVRKMIRMFLDKMPHSIEELETSFNNGDIKNVAHVAHRIRPTINSLGIESTANALKTIEKNAKSGKNLDAIEELLNKVKLEIAEVSEQMRLDLV